MILQELYNRVMGFFRQTDMEQKESTKETACNRLRVVLMQDRTNLTPELMERMRAELVELLSKYVEMDKEALELNLEQDGEQVALMLSIPVIRAKDEEEIKAALEAEDNKSEETGEAEETSEESENSEDESEETEDDEEKPQDEVSEDETEEETEKPAEEISDEESSAKNTKKKEN